MELIRCEGIGSTGRLAARARRLAGRPNIQEDEMSYELWDDLYEEKQRRQARAGHGDLRPGGSHRVGPVGDRKYGQRLIRFRREDLETYATK